MSKPERSTHASRNMPENIFPGIKGAVCLPVEERLLKNSVKVGECIAWKKPNNKGYAVMSVGGSRKLVHKLVYEKHFGPVPVGKEIDHICRNKACINPNHLEAVSHRENILRAMPYSSQNRKKTHCLRNHEFTKENTYITAGRRTCRKCRAFRQMRDRQRASARAAINSATAQ